MDKKELLKLSQKQIANEEFIKSFFKRKVDIDEFEALAKRVMFLEKKLRST